MPEIAPPTEAEMKVLRNLEAGRRGEAGFVHPEVAVRAMWSCITKGWMNAGRLTAAGKKLLSPPPPPAKWEITVLPEESKR